MADIFLARSTSEAGVERHVVLKRVLAERSLDERFAAMFLDEARLAAQLQHPNIAQVHDIGKLGESYFYTMEYVHGQDMRNVLRRFDHMRRQLPINVALYIESCALSGLHHAHTRTSSTGQPLGIVHRDVTPSNVMVSYEGAVKLLDFGVAKAAERATETNAGTIKGKIGYLSPEQARGSTTVDRRSDIFSAGIVLYEMLTCRRLFKRDSDFLTMTAIVNDEVLPPSTKRPDISAALDQLVLRALAKDPAARFQTAAEMVEAIEEVAAQERLALSGTAVGRVMRELFGERPEPWRDLPKFGAETAPTIAKGKQVTVTGETPLRIEVRATALRAASAADIESVELSQADLEAQLEQAPALYTVEPELSGPIRTDGTPASRSHWVNTPPPMQRVSLPPLPQPAPASMPAPSAPLPADAAGPIATGTKRGVALAGAIGAVLLLVVVVALTRESAPSAAPVADAAVAVVRVDAAVAVVAPPDASLPPPPAVPKTIAGAVAESSWATALELCGRGPARSLATEDRIRCGIAACNTKQRKVALQYYALLSRSEKSALDRACRANAITLAPAATTGSKTGSCSDRRYAEANPLRCQK